jgi:hypothetical protein
VNTLLGLLLLWGLQGGIACAIAQAKHRSGKEGFWWGALLGPIGIIYVLCMARGVPGVGPPGWYPDPAGDPVERYWNGHEWAFSRPNPGSNEDAPPAPGMGPPPLPPRGWERGKFFS